MRLVGGWVNPCRAFVQRPKIHQGPFHLERRRSVRQREYDHALRLSHSSLYSRDIPYPIGGRTEGHTDKTRTHRQADTHRRTQTYTDRQTGRYKQTYRHRHTQTDKQTDRQTDRQTDDRHTGTPIGGATDGHIYFFAGGLCTSVS